MIERRARGWSYQAIGKSYGVSKSRISQVFKIFEEGDIDKTIALLTMEEPDPQRGVRFFLSDIERAIKAYILCLSFTDLVWCYGVKHSIIKAEFVKRGVYIRSQTEATIVRRKLGQFIESIYGARVCSKCGEERPLRAFQRSSTGWLGLETRCSFCRGLKSIPPEFPEEDDL